MNKSVDKKIKVLLIEDSPCDVLVIRGMLINQAEGSFELEHAGNLAKGLEILQRNEIDVILSDLGLPDSYGLETFTALHTRFGHMPILVMSGMDDESLAIDAVKKGAQDYLVKGNVDGNCLRQSLRYAIERKHSEEVLRRSKEQYRSIFNSSPDAFIIFDIKGIIVDVNPAATAMYGYGEGEMIGLACEDIVRPDQADLFAEFKQRIDDGLKVTIESVGLRKNRTIFNSESHITPFNYNGSAHILAIVQNITERKQAEQKLQSQTEVLNSIISHIPHFVFWKNRDSVYLGCNDNFAKVAGVGRAEDIVGKTDYDLTWKRAEADFYRQCDKAVIQENKAMLNIEESQRQADGKENTILTSKVPLRGGNGEVVGLLGMYADITDRKKAEDAIRKSEERYRRITDSVTDYIFTVYVEKGQTLKTVHGSTSVAVTGYTPEEFEADKALWIKMVFPQDRDTVTLQAKRCVAGEPIGSLEHRIIRKDGSVRWVKNSMVRQYDFDGNLLSYDGLIRDIDERKRAEEALRRQRDTAQNYFDIAGVMLVAINTDRKVTSINKRGCEILGYEENEIVGKNWFNVCIPDQYMQTTKDYFQKFITGQAGCTACNENYVLTKHGQQRLIFWNNRVLKDDNGIIVGTLSSGEDVTETRRAEEELRKSKEQAETARAQIEQVNLQLKETYNELIESSRQAGMAEVASDVLHNVGNVLNSVNVSATFIKEKIMRSEISNLKKISDMIQQNMKDLPKFLTEDKQGKHIPIYLADAASHMASEHIEIVEKLNSLVNNINHIKEIVKMQQLYSKVSGVEIITTLDNIIEDAIEINNPGLQKRKIEIIRNYAELGFVMVDKQRILQIMVNLITNAEHALDASENKEKRITIRVYKTENDMVNIEVADNGIGIAKENLTKIFRHGFTTKKHGNGFGLHSGALAAKEIGGSLAVSSDGPDKGAYVYFAVAVKTSGDCAMQLKDQENRRILVIDDNEAIHEDFKMILTAAEKDTTSLEQTKAAIFGDVIVPEPKFSFTVDSAFQGQQGLEMIEKAQKQGRPYIMAFVDGRMPPGWDGIETIQKIWEKCPKLQIIFCTAYSDYSWEEVVRKLGHTDRLYILKKPFDNIEVQQIACSLSEKWMLLNNLDQMVEKRTEEIEEVRDITVFALARLAESRDPETGEHLERIRAYSQMLADQLRKKSPYSNQINDKFMEDLYRSSPLHDIGKVGIPDCILLKPDSLTHDEFEIMKQHSVIGADSLEETTRITSSGSFLKMAADIARYHHERFNGTGYPKGLIGTQIPLSARIVALADVYDALTSIRVYKPAFSPEIAHSMIMEEKGEHFDPEIIDAYVARRYDFLNVRNSCGAFEISIRK